MQNRFAAALAVVATCASTSASALVIDFNEFTTDGDFTYYDRSYSFIGNPFVADDFVFKSEYPGSTIDQSAFMVWAKDSIYQADPGNAAICLDINPAITSMAHVNGQTFDLYSIDLSDIYNSGLNVDISFNFYHSDGTIDSLDVKLDEAPGMETLIFNQSNLISVTWELPWAGEYSYVQFDNISVSTAAVPEPEVYAMMLAGLGLVFGASRRRA